METAKSKMNEEILHKKASDVLMRSREPLSLLSTTNIEKNLEPSPSLPFSASTNHTEKSPELDEEENLQAKGAASRHFDKEIIYNEIAPEQSETENLEDSQMDFELSLEKENVLNEQAEPSVSENKRFQRKKQEKSREVKLQKYDTVNDQVFIQ